MDIKLKNNPKLNIGQTAYTRLEYIESTGTQWIDTGLIFSHGFRLVTELTKTNDSTDFCAFAGSYTSGNHNILRIYNNKWNPCVGDNSTSQYGSVVKNTKYSIDISNANNKFNVIVDGTVLANNVSASGSYNNLSCWLFALHRTDTTNYQPFVGRMEEIKLYNENNILIGDFIPVKDSNGVVCMYDLVSEGFFYNQGTGDFIASPGIYNIELPEDIALRTTTLFHQNTPNINGLKLLDSILNYQKTHQTEVKLYYYPTTQTWHDIITTYPAIIPYYNQNPWVCVIICEAQDPEQLVEDILQILEDYPSLLSIITEYPTLVPVFLEYPTLAPIILEYPTLAPYVDEDNGLVHSLVDTGYYRFMDTDGNCYIDTGYLPTNNTKVEGIVKFSSLENFVAIASMGKTGDANFTFDIMFINNGYATNRMYWTNSYNIPVTVGTIYIIEDFTPSHSIVNGLTYPYDTGTGVRTGTLPLFGNFDGSNNASYNPKTGGCICNIKLYTSNVLMHYFVPFNGNNRQGMLDIHDLNNPVFYPNAGSGEFTYTIEPKNT
jgi:hypothetical protein